MTLPRFTERKNTQWFYSARSHQHKIIFFLVNLPCFWLDERVPNKTLTSLKWRLRHFFVMYASFIFTFLRHLKPICISFLFFLEFCEQFFYFPCDVAVLKLRFRLYSYQSAYFFTLSSVSRGGSFHPAASLSVSPSVLRSNFLTFTLFIQGLLCQMLTIGL